MMEREKSKILREVNEVKATEEKLIDEAPEEKRQTGKSLCTFICDNLLSYTTVTSVDRVAAWDYFTKEKLPIDITTNLCQRIW